MELAELPVEILLAICAQLCTHCLESDDRRAQRSPHLGPSERSEIRLRRIGLASLSRLSKAFHDIATPYLYHFLYHQKEDSCKFLPSLIRTITLRYAPP